MPTAQCCHRSHRDSSLSMSAWEYAAPTILEESARREESGFEGTELRFRQKGDEDLLLSLSDCQGRRPFATYSERSVYRVVASMHRISRVKQIELYRKWSMAHRINGGIRTDHLLPNRLCFSMISGYILSRDNNGCIPAAVYSTTSCTFIERQWYHCPTCPIRLCFGRLSPHKNDDRSNQAQINRAHSRYAGIT